MQISLRFYNPAAWMKLIRSFECWILLNSPKYADLPLSISNRMICCNLLLQTKVLVIWGSVFFPASINKFWFWLLAVLFFLKNMSVEGSVFMHASSDFDIFVILNLSNWNSCSLYHSLGFLDCVKFCILTQAYSSMVSFLWGFRFQQ